MSDPATKRRIPPWLFVVVAFGLLISAWSVLIVIAVNNQPEAIELPEKTAGEENP